MALSEAEGTLVLPETVVGKEAMVTTGGWTPPALVMVECTTGMADGPETTAWGGLATLGTTGVTDTGLELATDRDELEMVSTDIAASGA